MLKLLGNNEKQGNKCTFRFKREINMMFQFFQLIIIALRYNKICIIIFKLATMEQQINKSSSVIFVQKDREKKNDQKVSLHWRDARSYFYTHQITKALDEAKVQENVRSEIIELYITSKNRVDPNITKFKAYRDVLLQLNQALLSIQELYSRQQRECLPLIRIIQKKITSLRIVHIQYELKINALNEQECLYSISAFDLFKIVHDNKQMAQLTLKGVQTLRLQQFIKVINPSNTLQDNQMSWIRLFNPSQYLKIAINASLKFKIQSREQTNYQINDLEYFIGLFCEVREIKIIINIQKWRKALKWKNTLWNVWLCLRKLRNIRIQIACQIQEDQSQIGIYQVPLVRQVLFGGLASLKSISQLSLRSVIFHWSISKNDILAFEQTLNTIFENNHITHLQINNCRNIPSFPEITTLQFIDYTDSSVNMNSSFTRSGSLMSRIIKSNLSLRSVVCCRSLQEWSIDQKLFNQLETLIIKRCNRVNLDGVFSKTPSKIKYLDIDRSGIENLQHLSQIFPKLQNLTHLQLNKYSLGYQILDKVPSSLLQELHLSYSNITQQGLKEIDSKWPCIKHINLQWCNNLTANLWDICKFKGLVNLTVDLNSRILGEKKAYLRQLKCRGVSVDYYW